MTTFTPLASTAGGILIGLAAAMLLVCNGRIAGISGIVGGLLDGGDDSRGWRVYFVLGMVLGGLGLVLIDPDTIPAPVVDSLPMMAVAGLLVGFGTRLGGGCTSGHGVCGVSRLSKRSLVATGTFMAVAMLTVTVTRHLIGGLG